MEEQNRKKKNRIQIEPPLKAADEEFHEEKNKQYHEDFLFNDYLTYDVLRIIFQYLNYKDLSNAMMTCRKWLEAANHEKCSRGPQCSMNLINIAISSTRNYSLDFQTEIDNYYLCYFIGDTKSVDVDYIKPFIALFFIPEIHDSYNFGDIIDYISKLFPRNCKVIMLLASNYLILNEKISLPDDDFNKTSCVNMISALLPHTSDVKLSIVTITGTTSEDKFIEYTQMIKKAMRQNHEISACLMLFCDSDYSNGSYKSVGKRMIELTHLSLDNNERKISWYGCLMEVMYIDDETISSHTRARCVALLITGAIQTWSICMEHINQTTNIIKENLKLFHEQVKLQKHSVGFVFSSVKQLSDIQKYLTIFKELFSKVPLIGCYTDRIFGRDTITYVRPQLNPQEQYFVRFMILTYS